ncbi:putative Xaa-Pro aminopeptidase [Fulvia fulva]|uniref:Xaa-Pro aminopeptidase n=1 Tax=Passalora fulva TaxID=5499 RepID=A0A9Q8L9I0_PASFU|nr:putative Xaa-Pro aminopeptidase [Fulvia fulva]KAK4632296.1 putative Xaa-Pro aminopeptidase [Fulvia fulva]KAK4633529.1 putative Xaa-Pro aminopeptidase [Fulvia fulva]UJO13416.1 putative Xaa-Pro aminopeptidase [Fulvia fulva]WPV11361.1 putative Xaa-Pro aminopeptidase [Fulvia fulva]WPV25558.1 putative Xaa-Pro aminopeptidase [Fulvia fulva]
MRPGESVQEVGREVSINLRLRGGGNKYPAKSHARRVADKINVAEGKGLIVLEGTKTVNWPNSDMPAPFRQDRYFYYLTGCNEPGCFVTYHIDRDLLTLWLPPVDSDPRHMLYYGRGSTVAEALEKYDVDEAHYIKPPALKTLTYLTMDDNEIHNYSIVSDDTLSGPHSDLKPSTVKLRTAIDACRVIKDEHEIDLIRRANDITAAAHVKVMKGIHDFTNEAEVEAAYMSVCIARKAKEQAYDPIAGSGPNAATLHYSANVEDFGDGQTIVLDAGCEVERYASDVTRTLPINKKHPGHWPSQESEDIYSLVEEIQESCISQMLPGNKYIEITWHAHKVLIEGLLKLGILKGDAHKIFSAGVSTAFLPHGLGHHVGLEVHDVSPVPHPPAELDDVGADRRYVAWTDAAYKQWSPDSSALLPGTNAAQSDGAFHGAFHRSAAQLASVDAPSLEPGMVVTVEPGVYFNEPLLEKFLQDPKLSKYVDREVLRRYAPVGGVRIEDDILITKDGYENLTTAPKGEEMLKVIREAAAKR